MAAISSAADGTWIAGAAGTWVGGVAPTEGDTVTILNTHDVEIDGTIIVGADSATAAIQVNSGGRLFVPSTVAGNYTLTCKGDLKTDGTGGTIEFGTVANPIPVTRTFTLKLNYSATLADGEFGLLIAAGGTFTCQGVNPWGTAITDPDRCLLATDEAVNSTSLTVDVSTEWNDGDYIAIAPTGTTYSQYEIGQMNGDAVGTTLTVDGFGGAGGGLAYAHTGTDADVRAEIINLTRNVVIMNYDGVIGTPGNVAYVSFATTAVVDVDWTEFRYMGENAAGKYGVVINTTTGSCNLNRCSFHHFEDGGIEITGTSANNFTIQNCVTYLLASVTSRNTLIVPATTNSTWTVTNIWMIGKPTTSNFMISLTSLLGTVSYLRTAGTNGTGITIWPSTLALQGSVSYIKSHSNAGNGVIMYGNIATLNYPIVWHNAGSGILIYNMLNGYINYPELYGNTGQNIDLTSTVNHYIEINNMKSSSTSTVTTTYGVLSAVWNSGSEHLVLHGPQFSYTAGVRTAHTYDIRVATGEALLNNPKFGAITNYVVFGAADNIGATVKCQNYNQSATDHRTFIKQDTAIGISSVIQTDTAYYRTAAPSSKMTPSSAIYKLQSGTVQIPVASGANPTVSVYLRKSAAYNGNQPRLIVKRNDAVGITADTVMTTYAGAVDVDVAPGTFTVLSGQPGALTADGVIEVYVDCDGTAGYVNICDWSVTGAKTQADNLDAFYSWGLPFDGLLSEAAGGTAGFPPDPMSYGRG